MELLNLVIPRLMRVMIIVGELRFRPSFSRKKITLRRSLVQIGHRLGLASFAGEASSRLVRKLVYLEIEIDPLRKFFRVVHTVNSIFPKFELDRSIISEVMKVLKFTKIQLLRKVIFLRENEGRNLNSPTIKL